MVESEVAVSEYESPRLTLLGDVYDLTLGCDKTLGHTDGFTFEGLDIICSST